MHDGKRSERLAQAGHTRHAEDVLHPGLLEDELVDREHLDAVFREPSRYLPPPRVRRRPEPIDPPEPESPLARRSKLIALIIAAAVLFGSIAAAATLTEQEDTGLPSGAAKLEITGAAALGGFVIPDAERSSTPEPATSPDQQRTGTTDRKPEQPAPKQENRAAGVPADETSSTSPDPTSAPSEEPETTGTELAAEAVDPVATVREFYRLVANQPTDALSLLDPVLVGDQTGDLVRAWSSMDSIEIEEVEDQGNGTVRAVVLMTQPDGRRMRVTQLLQLAEGPVAMIANATLVSARHT
ncbi:hypothetical protein [Amycolatopsis palatopharyngis]|uniref:hypothetical protein n=1 Tax=Amycolatopsis palatopharyngis TaxID=187982 RepID=UPI000E25D30A|nr:hypothetical protein [Amycolatopsis palatopharyngis]